MKINVTIEDIAAGRKAYLDPDAKRPRCCPVAQSLMRHGFHTVGVSSLGIFLYDGAVEICHGVPRSVHRFMELFDKGLPVEPFEFDLEATP